ncbi:MAG: hypothetical protein FKY71_04695 [Spiribacter salinus]|uniref:Uncharacterized protein n=1 Tax=Spiribacter salinus TaxID=1335746 RepID=A0A540VTX6_9GAMM|nr:MAG: hypothetical protein FKY71_04695 [Spiribacter salinus]
MNSLKLPWHVQPDAMAGHNLINAEGEQVALFETEADAVATVDRMNREWLVGQSWFRQAVSEALRSDSGSPREGAHISKQGAVS